MGSIDRANQKLRLRGDTWHSVRRVPKVLIEKEGQAVGKNDFQAHRECRLAQLARQEGGRFLNDILVVMDARPARLRYALVHSVAVTLEKRALGHDVADEQHLLLALDLAGENRVQKNDDQRVLDTHPEPDDAPSRLNNPLNPALPCSCLRPQGDGSVGSHA